MDAGTSSNINEDTVVGESRDQGSKITVQTGLDPVPDDLAIYMEMTEKEIESTLNDEMESLGDLNPEIKTMIYDMKKARVLDTRRLIAERQRFLAERERFISAQSELKEKLKIAEWARTPAESDRDGGGKTRIFGSSVIPSAHEDENKSASVGQEAASDESCLTPSRMQRSAPLFKEAMLSDPVTVKVEKADDRLQELIKQVAELREESTARKPFSVKEEINRPIAPSDFKPDPGKAPKKKIRGIDALKAEEAMRNYPRLDSRDPVAILHFLALYQSYCDDLQADYDIEEPRLRRCIDANILYWLKENQKVDTSSREAILFGLRRIAEKDQVGRSMRLQRDVYENLYWDPSGGPEAGVSRIFEVVAMLVRGLKLDVYLDKQLCQWILAKLPDGFLLGDPIQTQERKGYFKWNVMQTQIEEEASLMQMSDPLGDGTKSNICRYSNWAMPVQWTTAQVGQEPVMQRPTMPPPNPHVQAMIAAPRQYPGGRPYFPPAAQGFALPNGMILRRPNGQREMRGQGYMPRPGQGAQNYQQNVQGPPRPYGNAQGQFSGQPGRPGNFVTRPPGQGFAPRPQILTQQPVAKVNAIVPQMDPDHMPPSQYPEAWKRRPVPYVDEGVEANRQGGMNRTQQNDIRVKYCRKKHCCMNCLEGGHYSKVCPNPRKELTPVMISEVNVVSVEEDIGDDPALDEINDAHVVEVDEDQSEQIQGQPDVIYQPTKEEWEDYYVAVHEENLEHFDNYMLEPDIVKLPECQISQMGDSDEKISEINEINVRNIDSVTENQTKMQENQKENKNVRNVKFNMYVDRAVNVEYMMKNGRISRVLSSDEKMPRPAMNIDGWAERLAEYRATKTKGIGTHPKPSQPGWMDEGKYYEFDRHLGKLVRVKQRDIAELYYLDELEGQDSEDPLIAGGGNGFGEIGFGEVTKSDMEGSPEFQSQLEQYVSEIIKKNCDKLFDEKMLTKSMRDELEKILLSRSQAFGSKKHLCKRNYLTPMGIELKPDAKLHRAEPRAMGPQQKEAMRKKIQDLLEMGLLVPDENPIFASPAFMVRKSNGDWRMVVDLRGLNDIVLKYVNVLPDVAMQLSWIAPGMKWFATFDALSGFDFLGVTDEASKYF